MLLAGRVGRAHGLDGSFYVLEARTALLESGMTVQLAGTDRQITRRAGTDQRPILRLEGCTDRSGAERLRGEALLTFEDHAPALPEGEWWAEQLEGCRVVDRGEEVGVVERLVVLPSCECLQVARSGGGEVLIPLVGDAIRSVDIERREIDVALEFLGELQ